MVNIVFKEFIKEKEDSLIRDCSDESGIYSPVEAVEAFILYCFGYDVRVASIFLLLGTHQVLVLLKPSTHSHQGICH